MPKKGHKSQAGVGDLYETPKVKLNLSVTEDAKNLLEQRASVMEISRSELIEQFARGSINLSTQSEEHEKLKVISQIINKWTNECTPERRELARWKKVHLLIQEISEVLKQ